MQGGGGGRVQPVPRPVQVSARDSGLQKPGAGQCTRHSAPGHHGNVSQFVAFALRFFVISL